MKFLAPILCLFLFFEGCGSRSESGIQGIQWTKNRYAQLFEIGFTPTDTFIKLYTFQNNKSQSDNREVVGQFFWGKTQKKSIQNFAKITNRNRYILLSTVFSRFFVELKQHQKIIGVDQSKYLPSSAFPQKNNIPSVQPFGEIMPEAALKLNPDILIAYFIGNQEKINLNRLQSPKTAVLFCQTHLEPHPLGRAEWIQFFSMFTQGKLTNQFELIEKQYFKLKKAISSFTSPSVMVNIPYSGTWDVPRQNAYLSILLKDANANPIWLSNNQYIGTGSAQIGLELGYNLLKNADFWINPGMCESIRCIQQTDPRIKECKPVKNKQVFQCDLKIESDGANEYWDLGAVHPEFVLRDFVKIFHPLYPNNSNNPFYFYRQLK